MIVAPESASLAHERSQPASRIGAIGTIVNTLLRPRAKRLSDGYNSDRARRSKRDRGVIESPERNFENGRLGARIPGWFAPVALIVALLAMQGAAQAQMAHGVSTFASQGQCASSGKFPAEICAFAETNAAAEFEEKAPRFSSRAACERAFRGCSLGFRGADGWAGRRGAVYFTPQRQGFRLSIKSERDATVVPIGAGLSFSPRSALRRDASINPRAPREYAGPPTGGGPAAAAFGVATPEGAKGPLPPAPPVDPNFDCAAVLEPSDKGEPSSGCYLAPTRKR